MTRVRKIRFLLGNVALYVFGTTFLRHVRNNYFFWRSKVKTYLNDTTYVDKHLEMITELRRNALTMNREDYANALDECMQLIQKT